LELWENLPSAISDLLALVTAVMTKSAWYILEYGLAGYLPGVFIKLGRYSDALKVRFPQILVSPIVFVKYALCAGLILIQAHTIVPAVALFCVVTNNGLGPRNICEYLTAPTVLGLTDGIPKANVSLFPGAKGRLSPSVTIKPDTWLLP
jgi:hypothetical protein